MNVTGSTVVVGTASITGSTSVVNTVTITGSTTLVGVSAITGSTAVVNIVSVTGSTVTVSQPALAATTDNVGAALATDRVMVGTTALTPVFVAIDAASSGDNALVASFATTRIRVLAINFVCAGAVTVRFEAGPAGTALTGQQQFVANSGLVLPFNPVGWFETEDTTTLNMELSAGVSVDGSLVYVEV